MSILELREAIEASIPAWVAVVALGFAVAVAAYGILTRGRRR